MRNMVSFNLKGNKCYTPDNDSIFETPYFHIPKVSLFFSIIVYASEKILKKS